MSEAFELVRIGSAVGAEVRGIDLSAGIGGNTAEALLAALGQHGVLVFRDQALSPEQHLAFARALAPININRFFTPVEGYPEIAEVRKEPEQKTNVGSSWHTDHSYDQVPALGSALYARQVPPLGGDTLFASMYAAWEALSDGLRATLSGLEAVHGSAHVFGARAIAEAGEDRGSRFRNAAQANQESVHPVAIAHPISGRTALYVNPQFTLRFKGWTDAESAPLLRYLGEVGTRPEHVLRLSWRPGTLALWDNRATWHQAINDYHGHRRLMHRITLEGCPLEAAA
jgi:taurine dioxygenase